MGKKDPISSDSNLPGALESPSTPEESLEVWARLVQRMGATDPSFARWFVEQMGSGLPKEDDDG